MPLRDSLVGTVLRGSGGTNYHVCECIGEGGQGWVFRATWGDASGHVVVVKVLRPDVVAQDSLLRFRREAEVLRMLSTQGLPNPYIVRFYDHAVAYVRSPYGPEPLALPFTVLEYVHGTTLDKVLRAQQGCGLGTERTRRLLRQICQALDVVHAQHVVHRDLKPSNILLATEGGNEVAKVTDFGLVKLAAMNLRRTTALAGASLGYAPPEQYEKGNERVSPRTDVFSLAAVAYEMLSGKPAFPFREGENPILIIMRILTEPRPTLRGAHGTLAPELETNARLVEALDRELTKAMAAEPESRHASVMDFWQAIEPSFRAASEAAQAVARRGHASSQRLVVSRRVQTAKLPQASFSSRPPGATDERESEAKASNPASWRWAITTPSHAQGTLAAAAFDPSGRTALAVSTHGLQRWERGVWAVASADNDAYPWASVRGLRWLDENRFLVFGDGGLVASLSSSDFDVERWPLHDPEINFLGAHIDPSGTTTLVGDRPYRNSVQRAIAGTTTGVVAQYSCNRLGLLADASETARLRAATRLDSGHLVACGDWGALVRLEGGRASYIGSICGGHLAAIAPLPDGAAVTVGVGGHALWLSPSLEPRLEAVQTTRDLLALVTSTTGEAWAGSAQARLLRRTASPSPTWIRMTGDLGLASNHIALWASKDTVRAIGCDGAVVEGRLA